MDKQLLFFYILVLSTIVISFTIYKKAYPNNALTCNDYILNTYLYIILSIVIVSITVLTMDSFKTSFMFGSRWKFIVLFLLSIASLIATMFISPKNTIPKHLFWLTFILFMGVTLYPIYKVAQHAEVLNSALLTTLMVVLFITAIAFYKPELISLSWGGYLLMALVIGIILRITSYFLISDSSTFNTVSYYFAYAFIVLFVFLLLYDTKKLQVNAEKCVVPDYINESIGIFLDIINLFSNITRAKLR